MTAKLLTVFLTLAFLWSIDAYCFWRFKTTIKAKWRAKVLFLLLSVNLLLGVLFFLYKIYGFYSLKQGLYLSIMLLYVPKVAVIAFSLVYDFFRFLQHYLSPPTPKTENMPLLSRSEFLKQGGIVAGVLPFLPLGYGTLSGVQDFKLHTHTLFFEHLPKNFAGFTIAQISDLHLGSFWTTAQVEQGIKLLLAQKPDAILITGDLVNRYAEEANPFLKILEKVQAPFGVFVSLGNHDYDDYWNWQTWNEAQKNKRIAKIKRLCQKLGWQLLCNEHQLIQKDEQQIAIIGVENWSSNLRFPQFGDLQKATEHLPEKTLKILLSHDPSHWRTQVLKHSQKIDLMLAGHTHGMQLGIDWGAWRWSPVKYFYEEWADFYQEGQQYLYVNRGFGYSDAFPARIGILPEITLITLQINA